MTYTWKISLCDNFLGYEYAADADIAKTQSLQQGHCAYFFGINGVITVDNINAEYIAQTT
jgi:hypothetical protein